MSDFEWGMLLGAAAALLGTYMPDIIDRWWRRR